MKALVLKASGGGGLGDCVKSLIAAAQYASLSGRALYVDWSGGVYADHGIDPFGQIFGLADIRTLDVLPTGEDVHPPAWQWRLEKSLHQVYIEDKWQHWDRAKVIEQYSFDLSVFDYPNEVLVMWEFDQIHKLVSHPSIDTLRSLRERFVKVATPIHAQLNASLNKLGNPQIGVHIRATQEFNNNKLGYRLQDYLAVVRALLAEQENATIYLATDNLEVEQEFCNTFSNTLTLSKWFASPGESIHLNPACPSKLEALQAAVLDVLM